jgi:hypothetical protein
MRTGGDHLSNEVAADAANVDVDSIVNIMMTLTIPSRATESPRRIERQLPSNRAITLPIRPPSPFTSAHTCLRLIAKPTVCGWHMAQCWLHAAIGASRASRVWRQLHQITNISLSIEHSAIVPIGGPTQQESPLSPATPVH